MRAHLHLMAGLALLFCLDSTTAAPPASALLRRQDDATSRTSLAPTVTTAAPSRSPSSTPSSQQPSATSDAKSTPSSISVTPTTAPSAPVNTSAPQATPTASKKSDSLLPIQPKVTPALGIAGVLLMISGFVFAIVGIKNRWVYVVGSAAYLGSLGCTVLITFLVTFPVSNAHQGGYFVAAFFSGVTLGLAALYFADVMEGFGCLLGGFCLSMWLLSLKEGGLISSSAGRAIFISAMSGGGYSLAFSHYTRTYGLIVSTSFAGSTIGVLGIDCLSCAGWKEFWLYLWNLSPSAFPLNTTTYPVTKGISAELGIVVVGAVFGIISQMRVLNFVKEHRQRSAARRLQERQDLDREEEQLGREIEDKFSKERAVWEADYGDKSQQKSTSSTPKTSTSISEKRASFSDSTRSPQKRDANSDRGISNQPHDTVKMSVLGDDEIQPIDSNGKPLPPKPAPVAEKSGPRVDSITSARSSSETAPTARCNAMSAGSIRRQPTAVAPAVVPLPFTIPQGEDAEDADDDRASLAAEPESNEGTIPARKRFSKRISGTPTAIPVPRTDGSPHDEVDDVQTVTGLDERRASSIAATLDDEFDQRSLSGMSLQRSSNGSTFGARTRSPSSLTSVDTSSAAHSNKEATEQASSASEHEQSMDAATPGAKDMGEAGSSSDNEGTIVPAKPAMRQSLTVSSDPKSNTSTSDLSSSTTRPKQVDTAHSSQADDAENPRQSNSNGSGPSSLSSQRGIRMSLSKDLLPGKYSKVALTYRTNEWAKHAQDADEPVNDPEIEPEVSEESRVPEERPAPVSDEIAGIVRPIKAKRMSKRISADSCAYPNALIRANSNTSNYSKVNPQRISRSASAMSLENMSRSNSQMQNKGMRSSSNPQLPTMPRSPVPAAHTTLMGKRESIINNRFSSQSFQSVSMPMLPASMDDENMPLSQRGKAIRQSLQMQTPQKARPKPPSASQKYQQAAWASASPQVQGFDSHQPRRSVGGHDQARRESMLASWRDSMRQASPSPMQDASMVTYEQRNAMMDEKRRKEIEEYNRARVAQELAIQRENLMRSPEMRDAHQKMMRRMQEKANRNAA